MRTLRRGLYIALGIAPSVADIPWAHRLVDDRWRLLMVVRMAIAMGLGLGGASWVVGGSVVADDPWILYVPIFVVAASSGQRHRDREHARLDRRLDTFRLGLAGASFAAVVTAYLLYNLWLNRPPHGHGGGPSWATPLFVVLGLATLAWMAWTRSREPLS